MSSSTDVRPYRVEVPQAKLDDLADRLRRAQWPDELPAVGDAYGVPGDRVRALARYWLDRFDWRALERRLNQYPQFLTEIDGTDIHFLHVRSPRADALPLVLTHGWPGSIVEYLDVIGALTEPTDPQAPAFHLVIPSLPGFGFAGPTRDTGWSRWRTARAWAELMRRLGYDRYGAVGNDGGSMISPELGRIDGEHVVGVHVTQLFSFPTGDPAEFAGMSAEEQSAMAKLQWFYENKFSFNLLQSQQPQTLAYALADSPIGLLGWNSQLFDEGVDADFVIANVALYWLTGTAGSAIRFYYEDAHHPEPADEPTVVPTALSMFAGDFESIRRFCDRDHRNIVSWRTHPEAGSHYAAHLEPDILLADLRSFYAGRR